MTLGTCGGAVVPGLGLIVVGVDQIAAGINNAQNPGSPSMSVIEYGAYSLSKGLGASENTAQTIGAYTPAALSTIFNIWGSLAACFRRGTPFRTPDGSKPVEQLRKGDKVLSRPEWNPLGRVEAKEVEEVFDRLGRVMLLRVSGREIGTTSEHPFWVKDRGWVSAGQLKAGDQLASEENGRWMAVEGVEETGRYETVYNVRVADYHTYFVGELDWDFSLWAHNVYSVDQLGALGQRARELKGLSKAKMDTLAIVRALKQDGSIVDIIAMSSRKAVPQVILDALSPTEQAVRGSLRHAEKVAMMYAVRQGWQVLEVAASRGICPTCAKWIRFFGGIAVSPLR